MRAGAAVIAAGLVVAALLAGAPVAGAHATVVSATPGNGTEIPGDQAPPDSVSITFDEPVTLPSGASSATVIDDAGDRVDAADGTLDESRTTLTIPLPSDLKRGAYIASWSVVSADTHPVGGSLQFGYGVPVSIEAVQAAPQPSPVLTLAVGATKGLLYLGLALAFGVLPVLLLLSGDAGRAARGVAFAGILLGIVASLGQLIVQCLWQASAQAAAVSWDGLWAFAVTGYGVAVLVRVAALLAAGVIVSRFPLRSWRGAAPLATAAVAVVATVVVNGHGGAGPWWRFLSTLVHATAAIAWIGGLMALGWLALRGRLRQTAPQALPRWSVYAGVSVAAIAASGALQSIVQVRYPAALVTTDYGVLLIAKLVLVIVALALAARGFLQARRLARGAGGGDAGAGDAGGRGSWAQAQSGEAERLRSGVRWEAGIAVTVLVVSGVLSSITPAEADYAPTASEHTSAGPYQVDVDVGPARVGPQSFRVTAVRPGADPNAPLPQQLIVSLASADGTVRDLPVDFPYRLPGAVSTTETTPITFASSSVNVPVSGSWTATITVVVSRFEQYTTEVAYDVE